MKQIAKTAEITARLQKAVGNGVSLDNLAVYEAIALNTRPIRKRHPLYKGAVASRDLLLEMAAQLERESIPIQIMHNGEVLPIGRAFHAQVVDLGAETELRTLFWVDKVHAEHVAKIDSGTLDQVSVSVLSKKLTCSACGFDYLGPKAAFDNIYSGTCDEGHVLGKDGVHAQLTGGLDQWFELSLVGRGGAQNAKIVNRDQSHFSPTSLRLAAGDGDLDDFILTAAADDNTEQDAMDLTALTAALTEQTTAAALNAAQVTTLTAANTALTADVTRLNDLVAAAGDAAVQLVARDATITELTASSTKADTALRAVLTKVLVASGNLTPELPASLDDVIAQIETASATLAATLAGGNKATGAEDDATKDKPVSSVGAFRTAARR